MRLIVDHSLATGFIPMNTWQQSAKLLFKRGVLERKVYNNDKLKFFSVLTFAKPSFDNVLQPEQHCRSGYSTYHTPAWQTLVHGKECFILLLHLFAGAAEERWYKGRIFHTLSNRNI